MTGLETSSHILKRDSSRINKVEPREIVLIYLGVFYLKGGNYGKNNNGKISQYL